MERDTGFETAPQPWRAALYQLSYSRAFASLTARYFETGIRRKPSAAIDNLWPTPVGSPRCRDVSYAAPADDRLWISAGG